jgi:uncharacterized protein (DUF983 family)
MSGEAFEDMFRESDGDDEDGDCGVDVDVMRGELLTNMVVVIVIGTVGNVVELCMSLERKLTLFVVVVTVVDFDKCLFFYYLSK